MASVFQRVEVVPTHDWLDMPPDYIRAAINLHDPCARKCRLFSVARCRQWVDRITHAPSRALIDLAEEFADGRVTAARLQRARRAVFRWAHPLWEIPYWPKDWVAHWASYNAAVPKIVPPCEGYFHSADEWSPAFTPVARDIFGNPFHPVLFNPRWRTESAVSLARTAYDTRDFALLPILADALEEAGCDIADVLTHCRDPQQVHVRGCWVVDGVLGKS